MLIWDFQTHNYSSVCLYSTYRNQNKQTSHLLVVKVPTCQELSNRTEERRLSADGAGPSAATTQPSIRTTVGLHGPSAVTTTKLGASASVPGAISTIGTTRRETARLATKGSVVTAEGATGESFRYPRPQFSEKHYSLGIHFQESKIRPMG